MLCLLSLMKVWFGYGLGLRRKEFQKPGASFSCARPAAPREAHNGIDAGWSDAEEMDVQACNAHYSEISLEIADIRSKWKPYAVGESFKMLENNPEYQTARLALASRAQEFAERVKR